MSAKPEQTHQRCLSLVPEIAAERQKRPETLVKRRRDEPNATRVGCRWSSVFGWPRRPPPVPQVYTSLSMTDMRATVSLRSMHS